ncbi:hypothetical protein ADK66_03090 [Micromonospora sp. NRRL B-16802]|uniref:hypothetical protein n=1 Tax=Micromonospora sp. NRRL B-16802 TaxID=1415541 RepID=UPI0006B017B1|nr:hypothetical protein [Micromonospora sp. NRRL B-16802]KOX15000.1 hypothetical protein ADK66_03090 [Micromonospora sp. NRRL B-16802]
MLAAEAPKITDWMQAWGSLTGLLLSGIAALATVLLLRHEIRVRRDEQQDSMAAQARMIFGSFSRFGDLRNRGVLDGVAVLVTNYSGAPILDVFVEVHHHGALADTPAVEGLIMDEKLFWFGLAVPVQDRAAREEEQFISVTVRFTDCNGYKWRRTDRQRLVRILPLGDRSWRDRVPGPQVAMGIGVVGVVLGVVALFVAA